ncbi:MAG TPA: carboxypeptidase regulatory-like domain-containing protein [Candidatus Acidoferrales bacterium]|nr:carboxypeptidase regulatory-like domain-containing protein [Candidatus Acidoferrales bacterium]
MRRKLMMWVMVGMLLGLGGAAIAQQMLGGISGTVKDSSGAVVPNATVTITNTDRNEVVRTVTTDANGGYTAPLLPLGHYSVSAGAPQFQTANVTGIQLHVNDQLTIDLTLQVGSTSQTVTVEAAPVHVDLQSATPTGLISGTQIRELSLGTRNYEQLVSLMPGVSMGTLNQLYIGNVLPSGLSAVVSFSINGQRNGSNYWTIDGIDNVDRGSDLTLSNFPSVDAISEFKVLRSEYDAEFGRAGGGIINVVTKSGTNQFHGDAYEFFRSDVLTANNFFNNAAKVARPPLRYNDFGYTIGGPVFIPNHYNTEKNKTFFFFSEEFRRVITYTTFNASVPTAALLGGNFANTVCVAFDSSGNCTAGSNSVTTINPAAAAYIKDFYSKFPGANNPAGGPFSLVNPQRNIFNGRQEVIRIDHTFNSKFSVFGRYEHDSIPTQEPGGLFTGDLLPGVATTSTNSPGWQAMGHYTYVITPNLLNDGGYGFNYSAIISNPIGLELSSQSPDVGSAITLPFASTLGRVPSLLISGISTITGFGPYNDYNRDHNVFDNVTWIKGRHTLKFGVSYHHYQKKENAAGNNVGSFSFPNTGSKSSFADCTPSPTTCSTEQAFANFLLGNLATFSQASQDAVADIRQQQWEFYGQDEFRMTPRVTVTLGLRYSRFGQPVSGNNELNNFDPQLYDPSKAPTISPTGQLCLVAACPGGGTPNPNFDPLNGFIIAGQNSPFGSHVSNNDNKDFAPRIGVAWDPFGNGKTAVRAGYGIFYDSTLVGTFEQNVFNDPPFTTSVSIANAPFTNPSNGNLNISANPPAFGGSGSAAFIGLPWHTPYTQQWSLDVQHQLQKDMMIDVGYYGNNAHHLLGVVDINEVRPGVGAANGLDPATFTSSTGELPLNQFRPFLGYGAISGIENEFNSNYHSLQAQFQKRWGASSLFVLNYTWSHNLTDNPSDRSNAPQNTYDIRAEYGPSALDRRQNITASYVYDLPWYKSQTGYVGHVLGGWEVSGLVYYYTGTPFTVTTSSNDPAGLGLLGASAASARPNIVGNPNSGAPHTIAEFFNTSAFATNPQTSGVPGDAGRGVVTGPSFQRWDISLFKNTKINERFNLQFRAETFNVFNHTNFNALSTNITSSSFGKVTSANDPRILQLGLKLYF